MRCIISNNPMIPYTERKIAPLDCACLAEQNDILHARVCIYKSLVTMAGSLRATRPRSYTTEEAIDLLFSLDDGAELPTSLVEDVESDDGDGEEPDYVAEDGSSLLVPPELLGSVPNLFTDEPALRDSLLHLDSDLASEDVDNTTETGM